MEKSYKMQQMEYFLTTTITIDTMAMNKEIPENSSSVSDFVIGSGEYDNHWAYFWK